MKNILIISTSLRKGGNSETLARAFADGAKSAGHSTEIVSLAGKTINFCRGCLACHKTQTCVINDDAAAITEKMPNADVIVFATPIYYYEMSGQMKTLLDRANPLYSIDYKFREIYLLTTAAEDEETTMDRAVTGLGGWIECFPKCELKGALLAGGVTDVGDIEGSDILKEAYKMGADK